MRLFPQQLCSSRIVAMLTPFLSAATALAGNPQILEYESDATDWMAAARCHEAYAFDRFYEGVLDASGCLAGSTNPVTLQLATGTVTITVLNGVTSLCPIQDGSSPSQVSDVLLAGVNSKAVFEFDPPVTAFYTYYASLPVGGTGTMKLYQNDLLQATLTSPASQHATQAMGHGFESFFVPIDRIEISTTDTAGSIIGAFGGLAAGESSLGTTTINNYIGPGGSPTVQLDFACTFVSTLQSGRIINTTQSLSHGCIRDAIAFANNGDVLVVEPSVYHEAIDFMGKTITIVSTNPNDAAVVADTVISADDTDWSAVRVVNGEGPNSALIGLTIANGKGTLAGGERRGGGLYVLNSSPTIDRCHFLNNSATQPGTAIQAAIGRGGAIYISDGSQPTIADCTFNANTSYNGGGIFAKRGGWGISGCDFFGNTSNLRGGALSVAASTGLNSTVTVVDCTFDGNSSASQGGAIATMNVDDVAGNDFLVLIVTDCIFTNNHASSGSSGGAIWASDARLKIQNSEFISNAGSTGAAVNMAGAGFSAPFTISNCVFRANVAKTGDSGGVVAVSSQAPGGMPVDIHQCLFVGNHGVSVIGGGNESTTTVTSCTFSGNGPHASVHARISPVFLINSIIWDDVIPSVSDSFEGDVLISNCNIKESSAGGSAVLHVDPGFVDPIGSDGIPGTGDEDFHLLPDSPCINAGLGFHDSRNPEFDFDGQPRFQGAGDLGIYEFALDCNGNDIADYIEIDDGLISDCNDNLQSDFCETGFDGNCNSVPDLCEIISGTLHDINDNGYPDEFEIGGPIGGNVTWSTSSGPCIRVVTQDISVTGSLTIQQGVRIRMMTGVKWTVLAGGTLTIAGTGDDKVEFVSVNVNPKPGDWGGIKFNAGSAGSVSHALIQHTLGHGIRIEGAAVPVSDCTIAHVAGINQPIGNSTTPAQPGGPAYGIYVTGNVTATYVRNVIEDVRGGAGGRGAFAVGGNAGAPGPHADDFGENGSPGGNATTNGSLGVTGATGGEAYGIFCGSQTNATIRDNIIRLIAGGAGGAGGGGGSGGWGGDGGTGGHLNIAQWPPACSGGHGGNGGNATNGGQGAPGAVGANAYGIRVLTAAGASIHQNLVAKVIGGSGGQGGYGGIGGHGGNGGDGATGNDYVLCGDGPGHGGDAGDGGNGGNGGAGGQGGKSFGISVGTSSAVVVSMAHNAIAELQYGPFGEAGSSGPAGPPGIAGAGAWGLQLVEAGSYLIPLPMFADDGADGDAGSGGLLGVAGGSGDLTGLRAEGQAVLSLANTILTSANPSASVGVTATGSASLTLSYTLLHGFQTPFGPGTSGAGLGNVLANPMFIDVGAGDFHLSSSSPAIDVGNNTAVPGQLGTDLDGLARIFDGDESGTATVDIGPYEYQPVAEPCPADITGNLVVDVDDLLLVINSWGMCAQCPADVTGNGVVDVDDLLMVINGWGSCR